MTKPEPKTFSLTIRGKPVAKARPRFVNTVRGVRTYDSQKDKVDVIKLQILQQIALFRLERPLAGPIGVEMTFYTRTPQSLTVANRTALEGKPNFKRPDLDNYVKMYMDAMNQWMYQDDGQIAELKASKRYSDNPRTEIIIREIIEEIDD